MTRAILTPIFILILASTLQAQPKEPNTYYSLGAQAFIDEPADRIANAETLWLGDITGKNKAATLAKIKGLGHLTALTFDDCDLSQINENDPVPAKVNNVGIGGHCKISQGTIRWFAKFPTDGEISFGCNVRGLELKLGKFSSATFSNCEISRSEVAKIVERIQQVTFIEVRLRDDK